MPVLEGTRYRVKTLPSGKRVKQTIAPNGRIIKVVPLRSKVNRTKTGERLNKRRRRINR